MAAPADFAWSFRNVCAHTREKAYFIAGHDESSEKELVVSFVLRWTGQWGNQPIPLNATGVCAVSVPDLNVLIMGTDGVIIRWGKSGQFIKEVVDDSDDGPQYYGDLQEIRKIGERAYVVGMGRTVYRCDAVSKWKRIDHSVRCLEDDESDVGFTSVDGFSESDIYAVGWNGEIWHYDGKHWQQVESPTNLALFRVVCGKDGNVYACGQEGVLVCGRGKTWRIIEHDETKDDFWGAAWFKGHLYLSTSNWIFILADGALRPSKIESRHDDLKFGKGVSFYRLDANDEVLWSIGEKMAIYTEDGINWTETAYH